MTSGHLKFITAVIRYMSHIVTEVCSVQATEHFHRKDHGSFIVCPYMNIKAETYAGAGGSHPSQDQAVLQIVIHWSYISVRCEAYCLDDGVGAVASCSNKMNY